MALAVSLALSGETMLVEKGSEVMKGVQSVGFTKFSIVASLTSILFLVAFSEK